ncbi:MAG: acyltransferase 3 [Chitinophagaceae bacterium]|nr:acyltransferase 3 [Chitinophagaceae bacterium]MDB5223599.1 acyltransferase 3 [Chitinophagaceae bacterium]
MPTRLFFKNLDALRFLAFLGVFIAHTLPVYNTPVHSINIADVLMSAFSFSYLGVPFFFTLSSFLITYRLLEEQKVVKDIYLLKFYLKRGLRIWPIYFLLIFICFLVIPVLFSALGVDKPTLPDVFPFIFFWSNFYMINHGMNFISALTILWSLAIEEQFYIFWGAMLKYCKQFLMPLIFILLAGSVIFCYYYLYVLNKKPMNLKIHSLYALPDFCFGAFIAIICQAKKNTFTFLKRLPNLFYVAVYFLLVAFFVFQNLGITHFDIVVVAVFNSACYALILFDQTFNDKRIFNAGKFKPINYLGRISYGLYIYHLLIASVMVKAFHFFSPAQNFYSSLLQAIITLLVTILVAHVSFRYFENYFLKLKDKL